MGRATQAVAQQHRDEIIASAADLFRTRGLNSTGIPEIMGRVGLTRGGFYRHFESKDRLAELAISQSMGDFAELLSSFGEGTDSHAEALGRYFEHFLSTTHQHNLSNGCPVAAMAGDFAREEDGTLAKAAFAEGFTRIVEALGRIGAKAGGPTDKESMNEALVALSTLIGTMILARATSGDPISGRVLAATREHFGVDVAPN